MSKINYEADISRGTYGIVSKVSRLDENGEKRYSALKRNLKDNCYDFCYSIKELDILAKTVGHPNIIAIKSVVRNCNLIDFPPLKEGNYIEADDIHFRFDMADCDLSHFIEDSRVNFLKKGELIIPETLNLFSQILLGVKYLHNNMIIHRDIKPNNILIFKDQRGRPYIAKVSDFGMSKKYTYQENQSPNVMAYSYRPPEILIGETYDTKSDIWCLGCILYEMIFHKMMINCHVLNTDKLTVGEKANVISKILRKASKPITNSDKEYLLKVKYNAKDAKQSRSSYYARLINYYPEEYIEGSRKFRFNPSDITSLLESMLEINPAKRVNITQCTDHDLFQVFIFRTQEIESVYKKSLADYTDSKIQIHNCFERQLLVTTIANIRNNRKEKPYSNYYSDRVAFHTLNIVDKYIYKKAMILQEKSHNLGNVGIFDSENEEENENLCLVFIYTVLYMAVKYFMSNINHISFSALINIEHLTTKKYKMKAKEFEDKLLEDKKYEFYEHTMFEIADLHKKRLRDEDSVELIELYTKLDGPQFIESTHKKVIDFFFSKVYSLSREDRKLLRKTGEWKIEN